MSSITACVCVTICIPFFILFFMSNARCCYAGSLQMILAITQGLRMLNGLIVSISSMAVLNIILPYTYHSQSFFHRVRSGTACYPSSQVQVLHSNY